MTNPRRPMPAILLSLGLPGLGEVYAGRPRAAAVTFAVVYFLNALTLAAIFAPLSGLSAVLLPLGIALGALVMVLVRATKAASQAPEPYALQPYNRWYWYLVAVLVNQFIWQPTGVSLIRSRLLEAFRIPSAAMEPTLLVGDFMFASKRPSDRRANRNDIVIVESPGNDRLMVVKRVVGTPGDTLSMRRGALIRNGTLVGEPFIQNIDSVTATKDDLGEGRSWQLAHLAERGTGRYDPDMRNWGPIIIPRDSVFLLGDNRDESYDSRFYGAVGMDRIRGRPLLIYFSIRNASVRWGRIGRRF